MIRINAIEFNSVHYQAMHCQSLSILAVCTSLKDVRYLHVKECKVCYWLCPQILSSSMGLDEGSPIMSCVY